MNDKNVNGNETQPTEQNGKKPEVEDTDDDNSNDFDNDNDNDNGSNSNDNNALGNGISNIKDEMDNDVEEFNNVTQTAPMAKRTRLKPQSLKLHHSKRKLKINTIHSR